MMPKIGSTLRALATFAVAASLFVGACSEGGSGASAPTGGPPPPPPPPPQGGGGPVWMQGVFDAASDFKDRCQVLRTGVDIEGNAFPDRAGSLLLELFWLRSWTHETYLWNDEVVDRNPAGFSDRLAYFAVLKTNATTPSGRDKDEFHFSQPTEEFLERRNSTPSSGYGASFVAFSTTPPRDYRVSYTEPNSPASMVVMGRPNLRRGTRILEIDGVDLVNANSQAEIDVLNNGLFPATAGESHTFKVEDPDGSIHTVTLISADIAPNPVNRTAIIDTPSGKVGYILLNTFSPFASEKAIADAISAIEPAGVSDLVVDLRYNGGGLLAVASQLSYMIAGDARTNGKTFELLQFNADAGNINPVTGEINQPAPFYDQGLGFSLAEGTPLSSLDLPRVFILSTDDTCSASESVINGLRGIDVEVVLIGGTTCGKPFGFYPTDNCGETYFTIQFRGVNDKGFGDYADGFAPQNSGSTFAVDAPGCAVADDFDHELGDESEALLAAALGYRQTGACPAPTSSVRVAASIRSAGSGLKTRAPAESIMENNRDMTMPDALERIRL